jgi:hypothetical protein
MDTQVKRIYIFGYKFVIVSRELEKDKWQVTVSLGNISHIYTDYTKERWDAEQACFGFFLVEYCQGGIFWQEPTDEDIPNLLAEQIGYGQIG